MTHTKPSSLTLHDHRAPLKASFSILNMPTFSLLSKLLAMELSTAPKYDFHTHWCTYSLPHDMKQ